MKNENYNTALKLVDVAARAYSLIFWLFVAATAFFVWLIP